MADDIEEILDNVASGPLKASGDEGSVEQHSISDLIKLADRKAASKGVDSHGRPRIFMCKLVPPGSA